MENYYFKHSNHFGDMFGIFEEFYRSNSMADVIIACDGKTINAHRIVLSAGSDYFRKALISIKQPNQFPVLFINDIAYDDMQSILEFIYRGQIVVTRDKVESLRQAAYKLRVKGFENFLKKPFLNNGLAPTSNQLKLSNGTMRNISMLNHEHIKRPLTNNDMVENKRPRISNTNFQLDHQNSKEKLIFNRYVNEESKRMSNGNKKNFNSTPHGMTNRIQFEQFLKRAQTLESKPESPKFANNDTKAATPDTVSITPVRHDNRSQNGDSRSHKISSESCDENEDNHRNENMENGLESVKTNGHSLNRESLNSHNMANGEECYSDDNEENYTYEMDPQSLNWDSYNDENVPENHDESEGYEDDEDYFEAVNRNNPSMEMMNPTALMKLNGQMNGPQGGFFYCEHCPKYFFDEDHLQVHIKRSHGLNKLNQCTICGKTYAWKSGLYKHKRAVHGITAKTLGPMPVNGEMNVMDSSPSSPEGLLAVPSSIPVATMPISLVKVKDEGHAIMA